MDSLAQSRDVGALEKLCSPELLKNRPNPFGFLITGGAYGEGRFGWHVYELNEVGGGKDAVFSTPLTCEDMGEQVFRFQDGRLTAYIPEAETFGINLRRHALTAHFDIARKWAGFDDEVSFESVRGAPSFQFRLGDHYRVDSIADGAGNPVKFASAGGVVSVEAPQTKSFVYDIKYQGIVDLPQYAGSISDDEVLLAQDYWYPIIGRQAAPYTLTSFTPKGWKVIGQGILESQNEQGDQTVSHFRMDMPVVYYSFSSAPFASVTDKVGKWRLSSFAANTGADLLHAENIVQADVLAFYDRMYSPYPFPTWATVATPKYGGGALEAYSYATYGNLPGEDPHEPSHTWWGGILPNSYLKSEWNESFAVFSEGFFQRERDLGNHDERMKAFIQDCLPDESFDAATVESGAPEIGPAAESLGYGKGAMVLQMLEDELGMPTYLKCLRAFVASASGRLVEWSDFEQIVNRVTGKDYGWFFAQWLRRTGWPSLEIDAIRYSDGTITANAKFQGDTYRMKMEVLIRYADGSRETKSVVIDGNGAIAIPVARKPSLVSFDPWRRFLRVYHPDEAPFSLAAIIHSAKRFVDPAHEDWASGAGGEGTMNALPKDLDGLVIVGSPESMPTLRPLFQKAGFQLAGNELTYEGTTLDLNHGAAMAVVDLPGGGHCCLVLGKTILAPSFGRAKICLTDEYGRFLRGYTPPKTSGWMTARF